MPKISLSQISLPHIPPISILAPIAVYSVFVILIRWGFAIDFDIVFFIIGVVVGTMLLDIVEMVFAGGEKLFFKSIWGEVLFGVLSVFVITATSSASGAGVVLAYFLRMLMMQMEEFVSTGSVTMWFTNARIVPSPMRSRILLAGGFLLFLFETYLFAL